MRTVAVCTVVLTAACVIGFGGAGATPKTPPHCHMVPGDCVTTTTPCPLPKQVAPAAQQGHQQGGPPPCTPKTTKVCGPSKKVCDN